MMTTPDPRPVDPRIERRVNELVVAFLLVPIAAHGAQLIQVALHHGANFATSKGAVAMLLGPSLFAAGMLALLRMYWAAWAAWAIDALLFGLVGAGDMIVGHVLSSRLVISAIVLPLLAVRIAQLQRRQVRSQQPERG